MSNNLIIHEAPTRADIKAARAHEKRVLASLPIPKNRALLQQLSERAKNGAGAIRQSGTPVVDRLKGLLARSQVICNPVNRANAVP